MLFFWTSYSKNPEKKSKPPQKYKAEQVFNNKIGNVSWVPNQHIKMISKGSSDNESVVTEKSDLP